jgi:Domain of unknown function (DUF1840)
MLYKFKSAATGDLILLGAHGDQLLRLLGREPAAQGIFEVDDMPSLIATLQAAVASTNATNGNDGNDGNNGHNNTSIAHAAANAANAADDADTAPAVSLRQRLWPMVEMLRAAHAARAVVVWGV